MLKYDNPCFIDSYQKCREFTAYKVITSFQAKMIQDNMLRPIRLNAGLGNPPEANYNKMPESVNKVIKIGIYFQKSEMSQFNVKMEKVIQQQRRDCE